MTEYRDKSTAMSATVLDDQTIRWAEMLEQRERVATGQTREVARERLAKRIGVLPGTLDNILRRRVKGVKTWITERIRAAVIHELEREIARLQAELHLARQCGCRPDTDEVISALAAIDAARALIKQAVM